MDKIIKFDFDSWPMPLSHKIIMYIYFLQNEYCIFLYFPKMQI